MHIVIMGCGRVGSTLARNLEARGHTTAVIDTNPDAFRRLGPGFAGITVTGMGFDRDVLVKAGIERADAFAAVSSGDNSNIISARVAREQFKIENVVARIYDPGRAEVYERLGVPTVATVPWAADQVLRRLVPAGSEPAWRDQTGEVRLDLVYAPFSWIGHRIAELEADASVRVAYLTRLGTGLIATPDTVIQEGDYLSLFMLESTAEASHAALDAGPEDH
ncbi:potassium channel family protein [Aeromicrobium endophyticum]|uniref:Trk system potassium uptake protein TrkA n=1 Tax=Aeromicrobium endophyticum TaxID=2292704 RepID=A0A371P6G0_9ACTN|nr:TrkA family potassium uptake protein [Aeromicrobium endophyticum]REK71066.1 TrkA family potassium uptake protein [Aeromicrobium endophyticum]